MVSAPHASLWDRLFESLSEPGTVEISGADLEPFGKRSLDRFLENRLLIQQALPDDLGPCGCGRDGCHSLLEEIDGKYFAICPSADLFPEEINKEEVTFYQINLPKILQVLRHANELEGESITDIARDNAYFLGRKTLGAEQPALVFCRRLNGRNAHDVFHQVRGAVDSGRILLMTAGNYNLDLHQVRLSHSMHIYPAEITRYQTAPDSPSLDWTRISSDILFKDAIEENVDLYLDSTCHVARYKGHYFSPSAKPFEVLTALARRAIATKGQGFLKKDDIYKILAGSDSFQIEDNRIPDVIREIKNSLKPLVDTDAMTQQEFDSFIDPQRNVGYRLTIPCDQVRLI